MVLGQVFLFSYSTNKKLYQKCQNSDFYWLWWRYIDDIFMIWHHGKNELYQFIDKLSKFNPTIKYTCDYSRERVHFLDVKLTCM